MVFGNHMDHPVWPLREYISDSISSSSAELHRLELRSDAVDKQTKGLVEMLESTVWRRDAMAEKAAARRASLTCSGSSMGSPKTPQLGHNSVMS